MNEITATQKTILEAAAHRPDGSIHPLPDNLKGGAANMVIDSLKSKGFASHHDGNNANPLLITPAGLEAIGQEPKQEDPTIKVIPSKLRVPRANSKQAKVIDMMRQPGGATLAQITSATNWQSHSVRGFISGVARKKLGLEVISEKDQEGNRIYRISPTNPSEQ